jgi:hypothetical protein
MGKFSLKKHKNEMFLKHFGGRRACFDSSTLTRSIGAGIWILTPEDWIQIA